LLPGEYAMNESSESEFLIEMRGAPNDLWYVRCFTEIKRPSGKEPDSILHLDPMLPMKEEEAKAMARELADSPEHKGKAVRWDIRR
jgi:hypothetical protein